VLGGERETARSSIVSPVPSKLKDPEMEPWQEVGGERSLRTLDFL
jgi:hypothetical protein